MILKELEQDINFLFVNATRKSIPYDILIKWCDAVEETLNNYTNISLSVKAGEQWQQLQDFRKV